MLGFTTYIHTSVMNFLWHKGVLYTIYTGSRGNIPGERGRKGINNMRKGEEIIRGYRIGEEWGV